MTVDRALSPASDLRVSSPVDPKHLLCFEPPDTWDYPTYARILTDLQAEYGEAVGHLNSLQWRVGDCLAAGERDFPDCYTQPVEERFSPSHMKNLLRVALAYPAHARQPDMSWSHHLACAALPTLAERLDCLARARAEGWTVTQLRAYLSPSTPREIPHIPGLYRAQSDAVRALVESFYTTPPAHMHPVEIETDWGMVRIEFVQDKKNEPG